MSRYHSSKTDQWTNPRPHSDASQRYRKHGPLQPMEREVVGCSIFAVGLVVLALAAIAYFILS